MNLKSLEVKMNDDLQVIFKSIYVIFQEVSIQHDKVEHVKLSSCFAMTSLTFTGKSLKHLFLNFDPKLKSAHISAPQLQELHVKKVAMEAELLLEAMPSLQLLCIQRIAHLHAFWKGHMYKLEEYSYYKDKNIQEILQTLAPNAKVIRKPLVARVQGLSLVTQAPMYDEYHLKHPELQIPFTPTKLLNEIMGTNIDVEACLKASVDKANRVKRVYHSMRLEREAEELIFHSWEEIAKRRNIPLRSDALN